MVGGRRASRRVAVRRIVNQALDLSMLPSLVLVLPLVGLMCLFKKILSYFLRIFAEKPISVLMPDSSIIPLAYKVK